MNKKRYQAKGTFLGEFSEEKFKEFFQKAFNGMRLSKALVTHRERKVYTTAENDDSHRVVVVFNDNCTVTLSNVSGEELYSFLSKPKPIDVDLLGKREISTFSTYQSLNVGNSRLKTEPVVFNMRTENDWSPYTAAGRKKIYEKINSVLDEEDLFISSFFKIEVILPVTHYITRTFKSTLVSDSNQEINFNFSFGSEDCILTLTTIFEVDDDLKYNKDQLKAIGKGKLEDLSSRFIKDLDIDVVEIREDGDFID
jgi:hypothetical protein